MHVCFKSSLLSRSYKVLPLIGLLLAIVLGFPAQADWNSSSSIESVATRVSIDVLAKGVKVTVQITADGLEKLTENTSQLALFSGSLSNQGTLNVFASHLIGFRIADAALLEAKAKMALTSSVPDASPVAKIHKTAVFFPFAQVSPQQLQVIPDFELLKKTGNEFAIAVSHNGLPVIDHGIMTKAEMLSLDWQDPWYSHFVNPALKRDHDDPVMAFLYVESQALKCEIVVRVKELASWMQLDLRDQNLIHEDEYEALKQKVGEFLLQQNSLTVDNKKLQPTLERIGYIRMGANDIQGYQPSAAQQPETTLIGVSLVYPIEDFPTIAQWQWHLFNEKIKSVSIRAYDPVGVFDSYVTPEYPVFEWENQIADIGMPALQSVAVVEAELLSDSTDYLIWLAIGLLLLFACWVFLANKKLRYYYLAGTIIVLVLMVLIIPPSSFSLFSAQHNRLDDKQAEALFHQLLWNVYQAFEEKQEGIVYDQLALSVSGDLLETIYLKNRRKLLVVDGAWSKISDIEMQTITPVQTKDEVEGMHYICEWLVIGEVIHWGHQHRRENMYRASIQVAPINGFWKIIKLESLDQQRMEAKG